MTVKAHDLHYAYKKVDAFSKFLLPGHTMTVAQNHENLRQAVLLLEKQKKELGKKYVLKDNEGKPVITKDGNAPWKDFPGYLEAEAVLLDEEVEVAIKQIPSAIIDEADPPVPASAIWLPMFSK